MIPCHQSNNHLALKKVLLCLYKACLVGLVAKKLSSYYLEDPTFTFNAVLLFRA